MEIGESITREVQIICCKECGCVIDNGLCSYGCAYDGNHLPGHAVIRTYHRVDTLLSEIVV